MTEERKGDERVGQEGLGGEGGPGPVRRLMRRDSTAERFSSTPNIDRRRTLLVALITALSGGFPSSAAGSSSDVGSHERSEG
jgi:hypothetical protein